MDMEGIILSSWDHIMGPQIEKLWLINKNSNRKVFVVPDSILRDFNVSKQWKDNASLKEVDMSVMKLYISMCGQLLLGEVDSFKGLEEWSSRFYVSENKILLSVLFHSDWKCPNLPKDAKKVCLCFGVFFKYEMYSFVLCNHVLIDQRIRKIVDFLKISKSQIDQSLNEVNHMVEDIIELLASLEKCNLSNSLIQSLHFPNCLGLNILPQAIVSHLQTSGCTVVVGSSNFLIDQVIHLLTLFISQDVSNSSIALEYAPKSYIIGIYIPKAIQGEGRDEKLFLEKAIKEVFALTVVDLDANKVWRTLPFRDSSKAYKNSVTLINEIGCLIPELISDLMFIEQNKGDCRHLIKSFFHVLMAKSCSLIKIIEHLRFCSKFLTKKEVIASLALKDVVDLDILFGCAEIIKPGITSTVLD